MKRIFFVILSVALIAGCSQNSKKKEGGTVLQDTPVTHTQQAPGEANAPAGAATPKAGVITVNADVLIPEVAAKYKGVVLQSTNVKKNATAKVEVPFGTKTAMPNTPFSVVVKSLIPHFTMSDGGVANVSMAEENPGIKVQIMEGDKVVFDSWLFQKYPDAHGFTNPDFKIIMLNTLLK